MTVVGIHGNYELDLDKVTCTCQNFKFKCKRHPIGDAARLCKHLKEHEGELSYNVQARVAAIDPTRKTAKGIRFPREQASAVADKVIDCINHFQVDKFAICGSYRRQKETIGDLDFLISFSALPGIDKEIENMINCIEYEADTTLTKGNISARFVFSGIQVDIKIISKDLWPYALMHYTGSMDENVRLRRKAKSLGYKLNEYGLHKISDDTLIKCESEEEVYKALGLPYVEPQNR